jgi:TatD DNase family protein
MWTDIHAHLYDYTDEQLTAECREARRCGVAAVINAATSLQTSRRVLSQCAHDICLHATVGISPFDSDNPGAEWPAVLEELAGRDRVVAMGETGLDFSNPRYPPLEKQLPVFERQLEIAAAAGLPVVVHSRGAETRVLQACRESGVRTAVFHCFTGSRADAEAIVGSGHFISFSGIVTFEKSNLADVVRSIPPDRIFVETDTPYLAPMPHRGRPNRPAWVTLVGEHVAALKGCSPAELAEKIAHSVESVFGIRPPAPSRSI